MANTKLIFYGTERSRTDNNHLELFLNSYDEIFIEINGEHICLDKSTAIKLAKTLRTEINKINQPF